MAPFSRKSHDPADDDLPVFKAGSLKHYIKFCGAMMQGLSLMQTKVEQVGDLEKLIVTLKERIAALEREETGLTGKVAACDKACADRLAQAQDQAQRIVDEAQASKAAAESVTARAAADLKAAQSKAEEIIAKAQAEAASVAASGRNEVMRAQAEAARIREEARAAETAARVLVNGAKAEEQGVKDQIAERQKELAGVVAEIDRLKSRFAAA